MLQYQIAKTTINITDKKSVLSHKKSEKINRKIFTLLEKELGDADFVVSDEEILKYFREDKFNRAIASKKNGAHGLWWLRGETIIEDWIMPLSLWTMAMLIMQMS